MAKSTFKRGTFKLQRSQVSTSGLGKPGALERKPYPPGQHGNEERDFDYSASQRKTKAKIPLRSQKSNL